MKTNLVKQKLRSGKPTFGTWLSLGNVHVARVLARLGFDWLTVDLEHGAIDWSQAGLLFGAIADAGCVPLARVPEGNPRDIKRTLDAGAWGIIVPMVDTVEQARQAISAAKYPPEGNRSLGGGLHTLNFGTDSQTYYRQANDEILVVLQTESPTGIANAEEIYRLPGVDAIFVGPVDLQARLQGLHGPATDADLEAALTKVVAVGKKTGTPTGMHTMDIESALRRAEQGMQFIALASDLRFLSTAATSAVNQLNTDTDKRNVTGY